MRIRADPTTSTPLVGFGNREHRLIRNYHDSQRALGEQRPHKEPNETRPRGAIPHPAAHLQQQRQIPLDRGRLPLLPRSGQPRGQNCHAQLRRHAEPDHAALQPHTAVSEAHLQHHAYPKDPLHMRQQQEGPARNERNADALAASHCRLVDLFGRLADQQRRWRFFDVA